MGTTKKKSANAEQPGRFAYEGLERVLHEKARLGIMTSLVTRPEGLLFGDLKRLCALTDGNLSRHLEVLREAGLVEVWKGFENRRPQTLCRLSAEGRERFVAYLEQLEQVIRDAMPKAARRSERLPELPPGSNRPSTVFSRRSSVGSRGRQSAVGQSQSTVTVGRRQSHSHYLEANPEPTRRFTSVGVARGLQTPRRRGSKAAPCNECEFRD